MARPSSYKPEYTEQAYRLTLLGLKDTELARFFEVAESSIHKWKKDYPEFSESIKKGKELKDVDVVEGLLKRALGYSFTETHHEVKTIAGKEHITQKTVQKHIPPDVTAQIFWLKNRQPDKWKDRAIDTDPTQDQTVSFKFTEVK